MQFSCLVLAIFGVLGDEEGSGVLGIEDGVNEGVTEGIDDGVAEGTSHRPQVSLHFSFSSLWRQSEVFLEAF